MDDSSKRINEIILGRDLLTDLGINLNVFDHIIEADYGKFKGSTAPMVDMGTYEFKYLETGKTTTK